MYGWWAFGTFQSLWHDISGEKPFLRFLLVLFRMQLDKMTQHIGTSDLRECWSFWETDSRNIYLIFFLSEIIQLKSSLTSFLRWISLLSSKDMMYNIYRDIRPSGMLILLWNTDSRKISDSSCYRFDHQIFSNFLTLYRFISPVTRRRNNIKDWPTFPSPSRPTLS